MHPMTDEELVGRTAEDGVALGEESRNCLNGLAGELSEQELETVTAGKVIGAPGYGVPAAVGPGFYGPRWGWGGGWGGWGWRGGAVAVRGPYGGGVFVRW